MIEDIMFDIPKIKYEFCSIGKEKYIIDDSKNSKQIETSNP